MTLSNMIVNGLAAGVGAALVGRILPNIFAAPETSEEKILRENKEEFLKYYYNDLIQTEYIP